MYMIRLLLLEIVFPIPRDCPSDRRVTATTAAIDACRCPKRRAQARWLTRRTPARPWTGPAGRWRPPTQKGRGGGEFVDVAVRTASVLPGRCGPSSSSAVRCGARPSRADERYSRFASPRQTFTRPSPRSVAEPQIPHSDRTLRSCRPSSFPVSRSRRSTPIWPPRRAASGSNAPRRSAPAPPSRPSTPRDCGDVAEAGSPPGGSGRASRPRRGLGATSCATAPRASRARSRTAPCCGPTRTSSSKA